MSEYSFSKYSLVVGNRCVFPPMVILLPVHSCTTGITGSAVGFHRLVSNGFYRRIHFGLDRWLLDLWEANIPDQQCLLSAQDHVAFAVCHFTRDFVFLLPMIKVHRTGSKILNWAVIVAFPIHCLLSQLEIRSKRAFALYSHRMLLLAPVSTSQGIWKLCDESSLLSQRGRMWGTGWGWLRVLTITIFKWCTVAVTYTGV